MSLETRRLRGDLIQFFKYVNGLDQINWYNRVIFKSDSANGLRQSARGHEFTIERQLVKNCNQRHNFFTNRVSCVWNRLPKEALNSNSLNVFKNNLDKIDLESYHNGA